MELPEKYYLSENAYIDFNINRIVGKNEKGETEEYRLTAQPFRVLKFFVINEGITLSEKTILDHLEEEYGHSPATVKNLISQINKCQYVNIQNETGLGYSLKVSNEAKNKTKQEALKAKNQSEEVLPTESTPGKNGGKKKKVKKIFAVLIPVILIVSIITGIFYACNSSFKAGNEIYHITLTNTSNISDNDFKTIEERVKIFTDGKKYSIDKNSDSIEMYLPKSAFSDNEIDYVLDCYLTRAINLYAYNKKSDDITNCIEIERKDIKSFKVMDGPIDGVDAKKYNISTDTYKYFSLVLTDEFIKKNEDKINSFGKNLAIAQDVDSNSQIYGYYTFTQSDGKTIYILNNDLSDNFVKLFEYNLTHSPLKRSYDSYIVDINSKTQWENVKGNKNKSENQCDADKIKSGSVTFSFDASLPSDGEKLDTEKALKKRLDALGIDYAFGSYSTDTEINYVIKSQLKNISLPVMNLIGSSGSYTLRSGLNEYTLSNCSAQSTSVSGDNKIMFLPNNYSDYDKEELADFEKSLNGKDKIYLTVDDIPLLSTDKDSIDVKNGTITFDKLCQAEDGEINENEIDDNHLYLVDLFKTIDETKVSNVYLSFNEYQFNVARNGKLPSIFDFDLQYSFDNEELRNKIKSVCPTATVGFDNFEHIYISLNLPVDDKLVSNSLKYSEEIYKAIDFENTAYEHINIYLIDENDADLERGRIFFDKNYSNSLHEGYIDANGIFTNGRLQKYQNEFKKAVESNQFLNSFEQNENSWSYDSEFHF